MDVCIRLILAFAQSKRFWMALAAVAVPLLQERLGIDPECATKVFWAVVALIVGDSVRGLQPKGELAITRALLKS